MLIKGLKFNLDLLNKYTFLYFSAHSFFSLTFTYTAYAFGLTNKSRKVYKQPKFN